MSLNLFSNILLLVLIAAWAYSLFFKPMRKLNDYYSRSVAFDTLFMRRKALETLNKALEIEGLTDLQQAGLLLDIGALYYKQRDYGQAVGYFDRGLALAGKAQFRYNRRFAQIVRAYVLNGQRDQARSVYNSLLKRQSYDKNFAKLEPAKKYL
jgi:tetratricopeptide (TPR) repeat protein